MTYTAAEKLQCVERELGYRRRVYARLLKGGKITPNKAREELGLMEDIRDDYAKLAAQERLL